MSKQERIKQSFDEIIRRSIEIDLSKADNTPIPSDSELQDMGYPLPPSDMYDRVMAECSRQSAGTAVKRIRWKKLAVAVIVAAIILCGIMSVSAVRTYIFRVISNVTHNGITFDWDSDMNEGLKPDSSEVFADAEAVMETELLNPEHIPDGYELHDIRIDGNNTIAFYKNGDGIVKIHQIIVSENEEIGSVISTSDGRTFSDTISGFDVTVTEFVREGDPKLWYEAVWHHNNIRYCISTNETFEELKKIIDGLR